METSHQFLRFCGVGKSKRVSQGEVADARKRGSKAEKTEGQRDRERERDRGTGGQ